MVINPRGTGGSGKSTLVRTVMGRYSERKCDYIAARTRPVGYWCYDNAHPPLYVVGQYETPCGGGDSMPNPQAVFDAVRRAAEAGADVLFEGIISQDDVTRTAALKLDGYPLLVLVLDVPIEECLAAIAQRRATRGTAKPLDPTNTVARAKRLAGVISRLKDAGIDVRRGDREFALRTTLEALGWSAS